MLGSVVINGQGGTLSWGYYVAARVPTWTIARAEDGSWALSGQLESVDPYRVSQHPLRFVANGLAWPIETLQIADASLSAVLGPEERRNGTVHQAAGHAT
jgi:hypothetical protein